jgi:poly-gamma-glutamate synthesis protein (capsule biosynthesis protein)
MLTFLSVGLVTLANNHIRDFGNTGVDETIFHCLNNGIDTVGAGNSLQEAERIWYKDIKGQVLAIINMAENEFAHATPNRSGANPYDLITLISNIQEAKKKAKHIIIILHGGLEYLHYPSPASVRLLRFVAEQGVTAIIRHHPHYVQGYEVYKGVPIFYSLGNFLFDSKNGIKKGWFEGMLVTIEISPDNTCSFQIHPFEQCRDDQKMKLLKGETKDCFFKRLKTYSNTIQNQFELNLEWEKIIEERKLKYKSLLIFQSEFLMKVVRRLKLLKYFRPGIKKALQWENYIRCEAHREIFLDVIGHKEKYR